MIIRNVRVFRENQTFVPGTIVIKDGLFQAITLEGMTGRAGRAVDLTDETVLDGEGCYAIPGMIDLHFHGCKGYDFCDGTRQAIEEIARYEASIGVTAIAPATMTLPVEKLESILACGAAFAAEQRGAGSTDSIRRGADLIGVNMEGPFISAVKKGAQDARHIIPCDVDVYRRFQRAADGLVKFIGIAPEEGDAVSFIQAVKDEVSVALAHTNADYDTAKAAFDAGADHAVHLYNAMPPFTHRAPGVVGAVADSRHVMSELICDGVHIHPSVVRTTFHMMGAERMILISDSMRATGMPDGQYTLGGLDVNVTGNRATLVSDGSLAGSATTLPDCVRVAVREMQLPLETAVACATANPAKSLGVYDQYGSISAGKRADVVLWDSELKLKAVVKDGVLLK
ncbi:N-acetylglucosamine-6-phosphate deacetylase [Hespellia stercorisuis]|uniref:N-acetylglucosamine-6-phosphate deacetylase n=1 Tax=Hespellia stercorisuis DSM 15480 TaxID=1121950 RepID=A0A1M6K9R9_9FIRM|nr:N-acetylglucosamine-6-phosphate deacetylase [Hespellia stercorisuis]SHJ55748.1 N-acetylglucosamine-6-phosphate deacetylase [Hespellia stercorisuis DSM 15480]